MADADFTTLTRIPNSSRRPQRGWLQGPTANLPALIHDRLFSALTAGISMAVAPPPMTGIVCLLAGFFTLWRLHKVANSRQRHWAGSSPLPASSGSRLDRC